MHNKWLSAALVTGAVVLAGRFLLLPLLPFLLALTFAVLLEPGVLWCQRRLHFRRAFAAAALTTLFLVTLGVGLGAAAVRLTEEGLSLLQRLPEMLRGLPALLDEVERRYEGFCRACPEELQQYLDRLLRQLSEEGTALAGELSMAALGWLSGLMKRLPQIVLFLFTTVMAVFFTTVSYPEILTFIRRQITPRARQRFQGVAGCLRTTFWRWLKAESILCLVTFVMLLLGFWYLGVDYALLTAGRVAIVDALPVLGTGTVLVPWSVYQLLLGSVPRGVALLALYAVILLVRNLLEPKLVAAQAGLPPLAALMAMYLGFRLFGVGGMLLAPVVMMFVKQLQDFGAVRIWK